MSSTCKLVLDPEGGMSFVYIMLRSYHSISTGLDFIKYNKNNMTFFFAETKLN